MSRIGKKPIVFPKNIKISQSADIVKVEGPKGILSSKLPEGITLTIGDGSMVVERKSEGSSKFGIDTDLNQGNIFGFKGSNTGTTSLRVTFHF